MTFNLNNIDFYVTDNGLTKIINYVNHTNFSLELTDKDLYCHNYKKVYLFLNDRHHFLEYKLNGVQYFIKCYEEYNKYYAFINTMELMIVKQKLK